MRFRFHLSTLFLTFTLVAVIFGWLLDRHRLQTERNLEKEHIESLSWAMASALYNNKVYAELNQLSPGKFELEKKQTLLTTIYFLARNESFEAEDQRGHCLMYADASLSLLNCKDVDEVRQMVRGVGFVTEFESAFLDPSHELYDDLDNFITRAFERQRRQPVYPVRTWLEAVKDGDPEQLRSSFSKRIRQQFDDERWKERLKTCQEALTREFGDYSPSEFGFEYMTSGDEDGQVTVFRKRKEFRTVQIVKEDEVWKIDQIDPLSVSEDGR